MGVDQAGADVRVKFNDKHEIIYLHHEIISLFNSIRRKPKQGALSCKNILISLRDLP